MHTFGTPSNAHIPVVAEMLETANVQSPRLDWHRKAQTRWTVEASLGI